MHKILRQYRASAQRHGAKWIEAHYGKHLLVTLGYAGHLKRFVLATTPGDHRHILNYEGEIKRWIREVSRKPSP